ncbi:MAG: aminoacyl-tRNA hydrolase [Spirochaetaceae bacterium]|jgi:PTH1 family peptidyl-tRNA hydrolase|nr:aminoacyl-tRNA hydrolase [Spirochaetaceae bacterium]
MIELAAFLGNPGPEYAETRHNAGRLLAAQAFRADMRWRQAYKGRYAKAGGCHLLMPETYMNLSGQSAHQAAAFFKIPPERILVVHDELELPLGQAGLKFSGGLGGHNGLRSMRECFGTADFWRLRIGIGRPSHADIAGWVLSPFAEAERPALDQVLRACADALLRILAQGPETLLPEWNKKKLL